MYQPAMMAMLCIAFEKILDIAMEKDHTDIHKDVIKDHDTVTNDVIHDLFKYALKTVEKEEGDNKGGNDIPTDRDA